MTGTRSKRALIAFTVLVAALSAAALTVRVSPAEAAIFAVNTTNDVNDGSCNAQHCSLVEAITAANQASDLDTIAFNIPGAGPHTIRLGRTLPAINHPVVVDATTQPGYAGKPIVELDGTLTTAESNGLALRGGGSAVRGLVINRFKRTGILLLARGNYLIEDNYIGTDQTGSVALGNGEHGIVLVREFFANTRNTIRRNVISGNVGWGIVIGAGSLAQPTGENVIQGNYIGTNATGTAPLGNTIDGIRILAPNNLIGGTGAGARNVISGNARHGIFMEGQGNANGNVVQGNLIGTAADGTSSLGNASAGVRIVDSAGNTVGGTAAGAANVIAFNGGDGVLVGQSFNDSRWSRNGILSNSILSNRGLGIRLVSRLSGVTPNDPGDSDPGPNQHQNFPVLTGASANTIAGTLNSTANTTFRLEFFANRESDPSGHGEGERFLGARDVTTDGSGNASFGFSSATPFGGSYVSATATDPANNTSEFSAVLFVAGQTPPPRLALSPSSATNYTGEEHCVLATVRDGSGNPLAGVTVRFSVSGANSTSGSATSDANGETEFCYTGPNAGADTIAAYADTNNNGVQEDGEPAGEAEKAWLVPPEQPPYLLVIDESSIDNGNAPGVFSVTDVNDHIATLALRTPLAAFDGANIGRSYTLHTGQVGDEGWFAPKTIPPAWTDAGPTFDGIRNFVGNPREPFPHDVGPGLGTADAKGDRESLLDKVPGVTPLRASALMLLADRRATVCAVVYDSGIGVNYGPLSGSLKGENLGTVAFRVLSSRPLFGYSSGSLPQVEVEVLDAGSVCRQELQLFADAPEPESSSRPYDTGRPAGG